MYSVSVFVDQRDSGGFARGLRIVNCSLRECDFECVCARGV